jgi:hypothetical protein
MGIMMACPQRLQGSVDKGGRSPGINTLASHPGQVTIFKLPLVLMALCFAFARDRPGLVFCPTPTGTPPARSARFNFPRVNCFVTSRQSTTAQNRNGNPDDSNAAQSDQRIFGKEFNKKGVAAGC